MTYCNIKLNQKNYSQYSSNITVEGYISNEIDNYWEQDKSLLTKSTHPIMK